MSEVKRLRLVDTQGYPALPVDDCIPGERWVSEDDFDRLAAERDALQQRLTAADERADSFDRLYTSSLDERDQLQQRVDVLEGFLREVVAIDPRGEFLGWQLDGKIDAALKPAEGGGDE